MLIYSLALHRTSGRPRSDMHMTVQYSVGHSGTGQASEGPRGAIHTQARFQKVEESLISWPLSTEAQLKTMLQHEARNFPEQSRPQTARQGT